MTRIRTAVVVGCVIAMLAPQAGADAKTKKPPTLKLTISNTRYCQDAECSPLDVGYLRTSSGPVSGTDNPMAVIDVKRGSIVVWTYRDARCDGASGCGGHNIYFENGGAGRRIGFVPARRGARTIKTTIKHPKGTTIRYFCTVNNHYQTGMTGILRVI